MDLDMLDFRESGRWMLTSDELMVLIDCKLDAERTTRKWFDFNVKNKARYCFSQSLRDDSERRLRRALFGLYSKGLIGLVEDDDKISVCVPDH